MIIVEIDAQDNGAHRNQIGKDIRTIPVGWVAIPQKFEEKALSCLPFICLNVEDGIITGIEQGNVPEQGPKEAQPFSETTLLELMSDHEYRFCLLELGLKSIDMTEEE